MKRPTVEAALHIRTRTSGSSYPSCRDHEEEFSLAAALIEARARAGLTPEQAARQMKTTHAVVTRLEGGGRMPSNESEDSLNPLKLA